MQRVFRSTLLAVLAATSLTACGDKVDVVGPPSQTVGTNVISVTVSPSNVPMNVGDKVTLAASVNAEAGVTNRTVTWSSSNTTVADVDANGVVTAKAVGTASIVASAVANTAIKGAAVVTVGGGSPGGPAVISISSINQTTCGLGGCNSVPANLGNVAGQVDVTLNVDPGSQRLLDVALLMNCGGADTVVAITTLASANVAPEAVESAAPVTLSFNTAQFNSTSGATAFKNGQCTLKARTRTNTTAGGTVTTTTTTGQAITLNNQDVLVGSLAASASNTDGRGLLWNGGNVTVTVTPVFYSGRTAATTTIAFEGKSTQVTGAGTKTATFIDSNDPASTNPLDINNITDPVAINTLNVSVIDAAGQPFSTNPCGTNLCSSQSVLAGAPAGIFPATSPFRLDTQKPAPGTFPITNNALQGTGPGGYIGSNFRFVADSAAGFVGPNAGSTAAAGNPVCAGNNGTANPITCNLDNGGVDKVTVTFQTRTAGAAASTYATQTNTTNLAETTTSTSLQVRMITVDALGNADTTTLAPLFGVDKSAPTMTQAGGPTSQATATTVGGTGQYSFAIADNLSGPNPKQLVAQTILASAFTSTSTMPAENTVFTNGNENTAGQQPCVIGRYNATQAAAGPNALPVFARDGTPLGFCTPVQYTLIGGSNVAANMSSLQGYATTRVIAVDQAGNQTAAFTNVVAEDASVPVVTSIDMPGSITGNASQAFSAAITDNVDIVGSYATINYAAAGIKLQYATTPGPGVAFDNVLTRAATATPTIPNFIKNLQVSTGGTAVPAPTSGNNASDIQITALDEVGNKGNSAAINFAPAVTFVAGSTTTYAPATFTQGFVINSATPTVLSNCPSAGCGAAGSPVANESDELQPHLHGCWIVGYLREPIQQQRWRVVSDRRCRQLVLRWNRLRGFGARQRCQSLLGLHLQL